MKASDILKEKGSMVRTISPDKTVIQALQSMIENKVGSLVVTERGNTPVGIITERDILRHAGRTDAWKETSISKIMTKNLIIGFPGDDIEVIMALMTQNRFRHVPILQDKKLAGIISIGDIVKAKLKDVKAENRYLNAYIMGKYPA
ncbi:MAG: CBS domain-containing protein [candidate division Zixibacteria bacterium]